MLLNRMMMRLILKVGLLTDGFVLKASSQLVQKAQSLNLPSVTMIEWSLDWMLLAIATSMEFKCLINKAEAAISHMHRLLLPRKRTTLIALMLFQVALYTDKTSKKIIGLYFWNMSKIQMLLFRWLHLPNVIMSNLKSLDGVTLRLMQLSFGMMN